MRVSPSPDCLNGRATASPLPSLLLRRTASGGTLLLLAGLSLLAIFALGRPPRARAQDLPARRGPDSITVRHVATTGSDAGDCSEPAAPCRTIRYALHQANPLDEVWVATGTYAGPATPIVVLDKTVTLLGGWAIDFSQRDPANYPTTLNAQGNGRVMQISGEVSPTIDGFVITGGDATIGIDAGKGGGIYSQNASPLILNNRIVANVANRSTATQGFGGGIYLEGAAASALISGNQVLSNTASLGYIGWGGGIHLEHSTATVASNTVRGNTALRIEEATTEPPLEPLQGNGGGICLNYSDATLRGNEVVDNIASASGRGGGGGIYVTKSSATVRGNTVEGNVSSPVSDGVGGGIAVYMCEAPTVTGNTVRGNTASQAAIGKGGGIGLKVTWDAQVNNNSVSDNVASTVYKGHGGGIFVKFGYQAVVSGNTVLSNSASLTGPGQGGGVFTRFSEATVRDNRIRNNDASTFDSGGGGGLYCADGAISVIGNLLEGNTAGNASPGYGGGLGLWTSTATVDGNTVLSNLACAACAGYGGGVYVDHCDAFELTNNIIARNSASAGGGGIEVLANRSPSSGSLVNNTFAANVQGSGEGVYASGSPQLTLVNNIIADHKVGIFAAQASAAVSASLTLLDGNANDIGGPGTILNQDPVYGPPGFVNPRSDDYHIRDGSAALDAGDPAGVPPAPATDIDGDPRPLGDGVDIGADEASGALRQMHVEDISLQHRQAQKRLTARITIVDASGAPVPGATVSVEWTLPDGPTRLQQEGTDDRGSARFALRFSTAGTYTITVIDVVKEGWLYDPHSNRETSDSIFVP